MKDRFTAGFLAGTLAGVVTTVIAYPLILADVSDLRIIDFASIIIFGKRPGGLGESIFALLTHWAVSGVGGIVFAYLLRYIRSRNILFKGLFMGGAIWFSTYALTLLFKVKGLEIIGLSSALYTLAVSLIYGIVLAFVWRALEERYEID